MVTRSVFGFAGVAAAGLAAAVALAGAASGAAAHEPDAPSEARVEAAGERLGDAIQRALRADGPLFTAEERALVERKCGEAAGSWDGFQFGMTDGILHCSNGRRVDDPEVRAMMERAGPRIGRRVSAAMASPQIRAAIEEVSREASAVALASIDQAAIAREAAAEAARAIEAARPEIERATEEARRAVEAARPEIERAMREAEAEIERARASSRRR